MDFHLWAFSYHHHGFSSLGFQLSPSSIFIYGLLAITTINFHLWAFHLHTYHPSSIPTCPPPLSLSLSLSTPHAFQTHPSFPYPFPVNLFAPILTCIHHSRHHSPCLIPHAHTHFSSLTFPLTTPRTHPRPLGLITIYAHISIQLPRCSPIL